VIVVYGLMLVVLRQVAWERRNNSAVNAEPELVCGSRSVGCDLHHRSRLPVFANAFGSASGRVPWACAHLMMLLASVSDQRTGSIAQKLRKPLTGTQNQGDEKELSREDV